jgi:hypothetical protein
VQGYVEKLEAQLSAYRQHLVKVWFFLHFSPFPSPLLSPSLSSFTYRNSSFFRNPAQMKLIELKRAQIKQLRHECQVQEERLHTETEAVQKKRMKLLPSVRHISRSQISLLASQELLKEDKKKLQIDQFCVGAVSRCIEDFKWKLITQLKAIFPIKQTPDGKFFTISGFPLPNSDFTGSLPFCLLFVPPPFALTLSAGCDEEIVATSLGHVAHVLFMISKYLDVPLRYPITPMCSRSVIRDEISRQTSPRFFFSSCFLSLLSLFHAFLFRAIHCCHCYPFC